MTAFSGVAVLIGMVAKTAVAQPGDEFPDHGVAADVSLSLGAAATVDGDGNRVVLIGLSCVRTTVLVTDALTGETD